MTTNELPVEKRIAAEPPIPAPESLAAPDPDEILSEPPSTQLLLEGVSTDDLTAPFLVDVMDAADDHTIALDGISVLHAERDGR